MKKNTNKVWLMALSLIVIMGVNIAKAQDAEKSTLSVNTSFNLVNNKIPFLVANLKTKIEKKFQPVEGMEVLFYLDKDAASGGKLVGKGKTNNKGKVAVAVSTAMKDEWNANPTHKFIAVTAKTKQFDETSTDIVVTKSRIELDTADDKNVKVTFSELKGDQWTAVKGVEFKIGVKRLLSEMPISETESYTTDSLGQIKAEFKRIGLPGDEHGNVILVAKVEDNETYGNLRFEKTLPWGVKATVEGGELGRQLWAGRFHSPVWLMFIAYSIVIGVWGTIIYLMYLIFKIYTIGVENKK